MCKSEHCRNRADDLNLDLATRGAGINPNPFDQASQDRPGLGLFDAPGFVRGSQRRNPRAVDLGQCRVQFDRCGLGSSVADLGPYLGQPVFGFCQLRADRRASRAVGDGFGKPIDSSLKFRKFAGKGRRLKAFGFGPTLLRCPILGRPFGERLGRQHALPQSRQNALGQFYHLDRAGVLACALLAIGDTGHALGRTHRIGPAA